MAIKRNTMSAYSLFKIAVDRGRRSMLLGALGAMIPKAPDIAVAGGKIAGKGLVDAASLGGPASPLNNAFKASAAISNGANSIAQWKMYRLARKAGKSREVAAAEAYAAGKVAKGTALYSKARDTTIASGNAGGSLLNKTKARYNALARPTGMPLAPTSLVKDTKKRSVWGRVKHAVTGGYAEG